KNPACVLVFRRKKVRLGERHVDTDVAARRFLERGGQHTHELEDALLELEGSTYSAGVAACELHPSGMAEHSDGPRLLVIGGDECASELGWDGEYREEARAYAHDTELARYLCSRERVLWLVRGVVRDRAESRKVREALGGFGACESGSATGEIWSFDVEPHQA